MVFGLLPSNGSMRAHCLILFLLLSPVFHLPLASAAQPVTIEGELEIPENYLQKKQMFSERNQTIPVQASQATSPSSFGNAILEYHFQDILKNNQIKPIEGLQNFEKSVNQSTQVDSSDFKIKTKIDVKKLQARLDIESFLDASFWSEDKFKTFRAQLKLFSKGSQLISLENRSDHQETKTYFNIEKNW